MGPLLWSKKLSDTDAQRQDGHVTGDLRLVQARPYNSHKIEQTTYFREVVFGSLAWQIVKDDPFEETADADFSVNILGTVYNRTLTIGHKPSGEADQGNYTTSIRWGSLASVLQRVDISGHMLRIYAPDPGTTTPFFIVVE
jgi:hypothetical protein